MKKSSLFFLVGVLLFSFCKKSESISETPVIEFVNVSSTTIRAGQDSLVLTIHYRDGDGDLGENNPDVRNCFVRDSRDAALFYEMRIQQLAPDGATIAIDGELELLIPATGLLNDLNLQEKTTFSIKLIDRAGHESNEIISPEITILK